MYKDWAVRNKLPNASTVVTNDPMEATYVGIHMWKQAVEKAKSTDVDKVIAAMAGQSFAAPSGYTLKMDETNHHLHKPVFIGDDQGRRPVQRRLEDQGPDPRPAVEPVHRRQREQEGRAGSEVIRPDCQSQSMGAAAPIFCIDRRGNRVCQFSIPSPPPIVK